MTEKKYRIGTFYLPENKLTMSSVTAYSRIFNQNWLGCIVYTVMAENGTEAKRKARELRLSYEKQKKIQKGQNKK
jgi:hypothetical protein